MTRTSSRIPFLTVAAATMLLAACVPQRPVAQAYWQRIEDRSPSGVGERLEHEIVGIGRGHVIHIM